jgi:hypothetical protein
MVVAESQNRPLTHLPSARLGTQRGSRAPNSITTGCSTVIIRVYALRPEAVRIAALAPIPFSKVRGRDPKKSRPEEDWPVPPGTPVILEKRSSLSPPQPFRQIRFFRTNRLLRRRVKSWSELHIQSLRGPDHSLPVNAVPPGPPSPIGTFCSPTQS